MTDTFSDVLNALAEKHKKMIDAYHRPYPNISNTEEISAFCCDKIQEVQAEMLAYLKNMNSDSPRSRDPLGTIDPKGFPSPEINTDNASIKGNDAFYVSKFKTDIWKEKILPINLCVNEFNRIQQMHANAQDTKAIEALIFQIEGDIKQLKCASS